MSDFEHELHDRLAARADAVPVAEEWDDLLDRVIRKSRRTTRGLAVVTVLAVCFGALGVVVAARGDGSTRAKQKATPAPQDRVDATHAQVPTLPALGNGPTYASSGTGAIGGSNSKSQGMLKVGSPVITTNGMWLSAAGGLGAPMAKVFTRTTASGEVIRAYRAKVAESADGGPPWWKPAEYCFPNGYAQADVSDANIAGAVASPLYAALRDNKSVGGAVSIIGVPEQSVHWVVVAQGPPDAAKMRATFPDGSHDEMQPVDGLAVLMGSGPVDASKTVTVEALAANGASLGSASLTVNGLIDAAAGGPDAACVPPQTLPAPGKEQPADPAAAKQAVEQTFAAAFHHGNTDEQFAQYFDDAHGFADVMKQLRAGSFKQQVDDAQMKLNDVVFLSPTEAAIRYEIDIPNYSTFSNRFTEAHLINGQWKLARAGWCNDVSMAGVQCPD
jgi:hypothetical protein